MWATPPTKAYDNAAAWDIRATSKTIVDEGLYGYIEYGTGIAVEIPEGYAGILIPRSSVRKTGLILANGIGLIDPDYRGELLFSFKYIPNTAQYEVGDRVGQILFIKTEPFQLVGSDSLSDTKRGDGGHGSSGK